MPNLLTLNAVRKIEMMSVQPCLFSLGFSHLAALFPSQDLPQNTPWTWIFSPEAQDQLLQRFFGSIHGSMFQNRVFHYGWKKDRKKRPRVASEQQKSPTTVASEKKKKKKHPTPSSNPHIWETSKRMRPSLPITWWASVPAMSQSVGPGNLPELDQIVAEIEDSLWW